MKSLVKNFLKEEDGLGTVEIVIIIAVLVGLAIIFREVIFSFLQQLLKKVVEGSDKAVDKPTSVPTYNISN